MATWDHFDLTRETGALDARSVPVGYAFEAERRQHVIYAGVDFHIHELAISMD